MPELHSDPFTLNVIQEHLQAAADEMFVRLGQASKSPIIYEVLDYAVALISPQSELIAEAQGVPGFTGVLPFAVQAIVEKFDLESMEAGDVYATNDPYSGGGTHLSDVCLIGPIVYEGEVVAFAANKAHWTEVGGMAAGSWTTDATEIYQEGLQLPGVQICHRGEPDQTILDLLAANVRLPDMTLSDLYAGLAAIRAGEARVRQLCRRYGPETYHSAVRDMLSHGERMARQQLNQLPAGVYEAKDWMDDDGLSEEPIPIRVRVTIDEAGFTADFSGSAPQAAGPINGTWARLQSSTRVVFKALTSPAYPNNEGCFRPVRVVCPMGTIFTAQRPAPVSTYWEAGASAVDLLWQALYPIAKDRLTVGHFLSICGTSLSGRDENGELFVLVEPQAGGWGAGINKDGENGLVAQGDGETYNIPVEVCETRYPLLVEQYALDIRSAGAGRYRGGRGLVRDYRILCEKAALTTTYGRHRFLPWGAEGGQSGSPNGAAVIPAGEKEAAVWAGKLTRYPLRRGDLTRLITGSGGGYGDPLQRPVSEVQKDVKNGYVTIEQAADAYGVTLDPETLEIRSMHPERAATGDNEQEETQ
ncbi:MAG TPA: hydantoinase B/oxoprolinase family protein [Candidatus Sulfomarinibacteraceae bacterium]|nr:hydantoinase B/oxoprolinase family protein [Candidatus Sulfomarinibacteraceae bacterium]